MRAQVTKSAKPELHTGSTASLSVIKSPQNDSYHKSSSLLNLTLPITDPYSRQKDEEDLDNGSSRHPLKNRTMLDGSNLKKKTFAPTSSCRSSRRNSVISSTYSIPYLREQSFTRFNQIYQSEEEETGPSSLEFISRRGSYELLPNPTQSSKEPLKVGFGSLPRQVFKKAVRKGFEFNLMVVGESGLGKSTLVNSMFLTDIYNGAENLSIFEQSQTLKVQSHKVELEENGVRLSLTVIDTPGFGDAVDNTSCWKPIVTHIDQQFEHFLESETKVERVEVPDTRVHACLYFIAPTGHGLKPLDVEFLKKIHRKVNIVPVIGKSDTCTKKEINLFKTKVKEI